MERLMESAKWRVEERSNTQAHKTWMRWRAQTLEPMSCDRLLHMRANTRKWWRVRCTVYRSRSAGFRKHPVAIGEKFGWIRFLSRDVHKCNRLFLDFNIEGILSVALLVVFRTTRRTLRCPFHESSLSNCYWVGCRRYSAASRLEVLLDEDDFRSSSRILERASFTTACGNSDTLKSMSISTSWVNEPVGCSLTGLTVLDNWVLVGFVGSLCCFQQLLNPILSSNNP